MGPLPKLAMVVTALFLLLFTLAVAPPAPRGSAMVASDHALASEAGAEVLRRGGNAVDAAVAAALAAGVVQPAGSGLGGGGFALVTDPSGLREVLDFREVAPAAAHRDMYLQEGLAEDASRRGGLAVAVPGEPRGLAELLERHGSLSAREVARPAITLARRGFPVGRHLAGALQRTRHGEVRALFEVQGRPATEGEVVRMEALARTIARWAATGGRDLHEGVAARAIAERVAQADGVLTADDLAAYQPAQREPIVATYRGHTIITMPPPSSGGVVLAQMLQVLEGFDLASLGHNSSDYVHLLAEVMKHAYADRAHHLGDPDFVEVPVARLVGPERATEVRQAIWPGRTFPAEHYGPLIAPQEGGGTQHISVLDAQGRAVALTTTINTAFGSGVVVEELGLVLNNEMDDFSIAPGVPNVFGLVGGEANAVAPGKRPLSSMTPTVVLDGEGRAVLVVGASGGSTIISAVLQAILNVIDFDMGPLEAVTAPRLHHQWQPDVLVVEPEFPLDVRRALQARGHEVQVRRAFSAVQAVATREGFLEGGADPRKGGQPAAVP